MKAFGRIKISIHAAREGGDLLRGYNKGIKRISIHAAREGGDMPSAEKAFFRNRFQSTPPVKAATGEPAA